MATATTENTIDREVDAASVDREKAAEERGRLARLLDAVERHAMPPGFPDPVAMQTWISLMCSW